MLEHTQVAITVFGGFEVVAYRVDGSEPDVLRGAAIQVDEDDEEIVDAILEAVRERLLEVLTEQSQQS